MASTSSIFWMYAWSNSAMHHIYFPPRLQLVALQQNPDCLSAHLGRQVALDGLFGEQADRPTGPTLRRFTADHGNDALLLGAIENLLGSWSLFVVNGAIQAVTDVAMGDVADRIGSKGECLRYLRCGETVGKLAQRKHSQDDAYLLNAPSQQLADLREVFRLDFDRDRAARHTPV